MIFDYRPGVSGSIRRPRSPFSESGDKVDIPTLLQDHRSGQTITIPLSDFNNIANVRAVLHAIDCNKSYAPFAGIKIGRSFAVAVNKRKTTAYLVAYGQVRNPPCENCTGRIKDGKVIKCIVGRGDIPFGITSKCARCQNIGKACTFTRPRSNTEPFTDYYDEFPSIQLFAAEVFSPFVHDARRIRIVFKDKNKQRKAHQAVGSQREDSFDDPDKGCDPSDPGPFILVTPRQIIPPRRTQSKQDDVDENRVERHESDQSTDDGSMEDEDEVEEEEIEYGLDESWRGGAESGDGGKNDGGGVKGDATEQDGGMDEDDTAVEGMDEDGPDEDEPEEERMEEDVDKSVDERESWEIDADEDEDRVEDGDEEDEDENVDQKDLTSDVTDGNDTYDNSDDDEAEQYQAQTDGGFDDTPPSEYAVPTQTSKHAAPNQAMHRIPKAPVKVILTDEEVNELLFS